MTERPIIASSAANPPADNPQRRRKILRAVAPASDFLRIMTSSARHRSSRWAVPQR